MFYSSDALAGRDILVVEDEYFLADYITSVIASVGGSFRGPFASANDALAHLAQTNELPKAATLNVKLTDGTSFPVADELSRLGVPFVFITANNATSLPDRFADCPNLAKPFAAYEVVQALVALLEGKPRHAAKATG